MPLVTTAAVDISTKGTPHLMHYLHFEEYPKG
jgi:hypothetical protein